MSVERRRGNRGRDMSENVKPPAVRVDVYFLKQSG